MLEWIEIHNLPPFLAESPGLDYARQRYYSSRSGRFLTADPYRASAGPWAAGTVERAVEFGMGRLWRRSAGLSRRRPVAQTNPQTWNRYAYVAGDPVNYVDPWGLDGHATDELWLDGQLWVVTEVDGEGVPWSVTMAFFPLRFAQRGLGLGETELPGGGASEAATGNGVTKAQRSAERLSKRPLRDSCDRTLSKPGTSANDIRAGARRAVIRDGTVSTELYSSLYKGEAAPAGEALERLYPGRTVGEYLRTHPNAGAISDLNGNRIFVRSSYFDFVGQGCALAIVMHELPHNATGLADDRIQGLSGHPSVGGSRDITLQLLIDCLF